MPETLPLETIIPANTGLAVTVARGQCLRIRGWTTADTVFFNRHNLRERFDQARTKTNQHTLFVTTGHVLYSKLNNALATIVADTFAGRHDLEKGMCTPAVHALKRRTGVARDTYLRPLSAADYPDHGCWENLSTALAPYGIPPEDIPSPINLFQHMAIDLATGRIVNTALRPEGPSGAYITFRAEMDLLVGISACPDMAVGGRELHVAILAGT